MKIEILGSGCAKCKQLAASTETAVKELNLSAEIVKVTEMEKITGYGVMMTPALVIDGVVVSGGRALKPDEIKKLLLEKGTNHEKQSPRGNCGCCGA